MCLAVPMRVVSVAGPRATCEGRNGLVDVDTLLCGPVAPGDWVLTFLGGAREVVSAEEAARVDAALDALEAIRDGRPPDLDACFADLVGREPELPEHLRQKENLA
ncbi:MAG: HypC/HybG/HupF family hydrogenase formation chaperone [Anaeromyxobacter sp.]